MKKIILIFSVIVISYSCKAQDNNINSNETTINGNNFLGNNVSLITQHFGQPNSIEDYYHEMDDVTIYKYVYDNIIFTTNNNITYSFEITGNNYVFTSNNIKVGDNIQTLQSMYPLSFINKSLEGLVLGFNDIDMFIVISYNSNNNLIDKIAMYSY
jgi:hypothetical protein